MLLFFVDELQALKDNIEAPNIIAHRYLNEMNMV